MSTSHSDDAAEIPTAPERPRPRMEVLPREVLDTLDMPPKGWSLAIDEPVDTSSGGGLESQVLLARARQKLLGWDDMPVTVGRYRVLERIGQGGMGVVYAAHDDELDRDVAIKILRSELAPGTKGRQRLVREAQATAKLSHPNVVHVYEVGQQGEQVFMAMELVRGRTLRAWLALRRRTWTEIVAMFVQAGEGLVAAHDHGIVHRDFKPDNVLIGEGATDRERPRVVDFGLARASADMSTGEHPVLRDLDITRTGTVLGTPAYMAPEQLSRSEPDARSDQFSFCVALFEALYGKRPFAGSTYTELADSLSAGEPVAVGDRRDVPAHLHAIVMRGLSRSPFERHASMRALLDELAGATRTRPRKRWIATAVLALVVGASAFGFAMRPNAEATTVADATDADDPWAEIVAASDLPPVVSPPLADDPAQMHVERLRNGLTIYVAHRPLEPMVAVGLAVRAGPNEQGDQVGLPRLVTASLVGGTEKIGVLDQLREQPLRALDHAMIEALPGVREPHARELLLGSIAAVEATTAPYWYEGELFGAAQKLGGRGTMILDRHGTLLMVKQPSHRVGAWLDLLAESVRSPVFRNFLHTASGELEYTAGLGADRPGASAELKALTHSTGIQHDRERHIGGLLEVPLAAAREFHRTWYRPNNSALVFVGDITPEQAVALAERSFGEWEPAAIPATSTIDEPLPPGRTLIESEGPGSPMVTFTWPMPALGTREYAELEVLVSALYGRVGLLAATLNGRTHGWGAWIGDARDLHVMAVPQQGDAHEVTERVLLDALATIAEDRLPDDIWAGALADAQLARLDWARGPGQLVLAATTSFFARQPWATTASSLGAAPPTRAQIVAAARKLLARNHLVTYERTGKLVVPPVPTLPRVPDDGDDTSRWSPFVAQLIESPAQDTEPRFLVEGSHFERTHHGAGRVITTNADGPLFWLTWVHPIGAAEDPWACDATRARMRALPVVGTEVRVSCTVADTRVRIVGPTARFEEMLPELVRWLDGADYPELDLHDYGRHIVENRKSERTQPFLRTTWTSLWALLGDRGLDPLLPSDSELRSRASVAIPETRAKMVRYDADVLYVGPHADRLRAALPTPRDRGSPGPELRDYRVRSEPEVVVMHDPDHDRVSVVASLPWLANDPVEELAARFHQSAVLEAEHTSRFAPDYEHLGYELWWTPDPALGVGVAFRVDGKDVPAALVAARDALRKKPTREEYVRRHDVLETDFRAGRWAPKNVPALVYGWAPDGSDPRVAQWLALPSLRHEDLLRYHERVDAEVPALVVVGDLTTIDMNAVAELGKIVRVEPEQIMRDASFGAFGNDLGSALDN